MLTALVISSIYNPLTSQPINYSTQSHNHLIGLELADSAETSDVLEIDMLIGLDSYWKLVEWKSFQGRQWLFTQW